MERIQEEIEKNLHDLLPTTKYEITDHKEESFKWAMYYQKHVQYLLAENKRLNDVLKKINHRATSYSNHEVPAIVLNEIREMAGYATNQFIDHQALREDEKR